MSKDMKLYNNIICNSWKLETIKIPIHSEIDKLCNNFSALLYSRQNEQTIAKEITQLNLISKCNVKKGRHNAYLYWVEKESKLTCGVWNQNNGRSGEDREVVTGKGSGEFLVCWWRSILDLGGGHEGSLHEIHGAIYTWVVFSSEWCYTWINTFIFSVNR